LHVWSVRAARDVYEREGGTPRTSSARSGTLGPAIGGLPMPPVKTVKRRRRSRRQRRQRRQRREEGRRWRILVVRGVGLSSQQEIRVLEARPDHL